MSRVAKDKPSGSASGEGGLGFSVGVEEEEQAFSVRVRKNMSGFFCTSEEDGERGYWVATEAGESIELQYKWKRGGRRVFLGSPPLREIWASPCKKQKQMGFKMDRLLYRPNQLNVFRTGGP